jgi:hypothetical protein
MRWMYERETMLTDEKGRQYKATTLFEEPIEGAKRVRVAYYQGRLPKNQRNNKE